jgi:hypothetical protein
VCVGLAHTDPHLFLRRHNLSVTDVACGLSRKEVVPLPPLRWRSDLSQAAKYHAHAMAASGGACYQRDTCPGHCGPFEGRCAFLARVHTFHACGDDDVVWQLIGKGTVDDVMVHLPKCVHVRVCTRVHVRVCVREG